MEKYFVQICVVLCTEKYYVQIVLCSIWSSMSHISRCCFIKPKSVVVFFLLDRIPFRTWYMHGAAAIGLIALDMRTHQDIYFWGVTKPVIIYKTV